MMKSSVLVDISLCFLSLYFSFDWFQLSWFSGDRVLSCFLVLCSHRSFLLLLAYRCVCTSAYISLLLFAVIILFLPSFSVNLWNNFYLCTHFLADDYLCLNCECYFNFSTIQNYLVFNIIRKTFKYSTIFLFRSIFIRIKLHSYFLTNNLIHKKTPGIFQRLSQHISHNAVGINFYGLFSVSSDNI